MTAPHSSDSPEHATPAADTPEFFCPNCDYNLRGLTIDRCPECGHDFDRAQLLAQQSDEPRDAVPWDRHRSPVAFFETWKLVAFSPRTLAANFPNAHHEHFARLYAIYSSLAAIGVGLIAIAVFVGNPVALIGGAMFGFALFTGFGACERTLAALLRRCSRPPGIAHPGDYWLGLIRYASGFKILSIGAVIVASFFPRDRYSDADELFIMCVVSAPTIWWIATIYAMALRSTKGVADTLVALAAPFIAGLIGFVVAVLIVMLGLFLISAIFH